MNYRMIQTVTQSKLTLVVALVAALVSERCLGWGDGGHMIVAKIAYDRLNKNAKVEADRLLAISIDPASVTAKTGDFVNAAHWADDVRPFPDFAALADNHFIDQPFSPDGSALPEDLPKPQNVVKALDEYV